MVRGPLAYPRVSDVHARGAAFNYAAVGRSPRASGGAGHDWEARMRTITEMQPNISKWFDRDVWTRAVNDARYTSGPAPGWWLGAGPCACQVRRG